MPKTLIEQKPDFSKKVKGGNKLAIAEWFLDTIQGEGINIGTPSSFIRLQGCTLSCVWCDTLDVWPYGNEYSFEEMFKLIEESNLQAKLLSNNYHLILTGGSPLKQQVQLVEFIEEFKIRYGFKPYIELENEAVLMPSRDIIPLIDCWNNSPKLNNSGMKERVRYKPEILKSTASLNNSWFKFVIQNENDWNEIKKDFIDTDIINREQIILMPEGQTQDELSKTRELVADIVIREQVLFTDRLHVTIWNRKTGV